MKPKNLRRLDSACVAGFGDATYGNHAGAAGAEYGLDLVLAAPTVAYQVLTAAGEEMLIDHPGRLPDPSRIREIREPMAEVTVVTAADYVGAAMTLLAERRAEQKRVEYAGRQVALYYDIPLAEILDGFFDRLKSASQGYASMDYDFQCFRPAPVARLDILINGDKVDALSSNGHSRAGAGAGARVGA